MPKQPVSPIVTSNLFAPMRAELLRILGTLTEAQWNVPTACTGWSVKDVALHLLADDIGVLSRRRDGFSQRSDFDSWADLVGWINQRNGLWVEATRHMSTRLLCQLLEMVGKLCDDYITSLDPNAPGVPVSWTGSAPAPNWLDIAREYSERWLHHQHICDAVGITSLKERVYFYPLLDAFLRAMPHSYRDIDAASQTTLTLVIPGAAGGSWHLVKEEEGWALFSQVDTLSACVVTMPAETAWRLFSKGISSEQSRRETEIEGNVPLAEPLLRMVSILA